MRALNIVFFFLLIVTSAVAQEDVWMHPNKGQWDSRIEYKIDLELGEMLIEKDGFTYFLNDAKQKMQHSHEDEGHSKEPSETFHAHVIKQKFIGSNWSGSRIEEGSSQFYRNYIIGNDKSKHASMLYSYNQVAYNEFYPGIDLLMDSRNAQFKYSLRVRAGVDPSVIQLGYEGQSGLKLDEAGNLRILNDFGEIVESKPTAWYITDSGREFVEVKFRLEGDRLAFEFPNGIDVSKELIIDPSLTFSSFSGATADNWGFTACPDSFGRLFGGSIVFGLGYPISPGAYDTTFNGGNIDVAISKFSEDGTYLIYSTYLGGNGSETPNSIVSSPSGELYIFGITSSPNFPMAGSPYDPVYTGGPAISSALTNNLDFSGGQDLYIAKLNPTGTALVASTYFGGTGTDGINVSNLRYNYGDQFRGDIVLDPAGNVYVASTTMSLDFPTLMGAQGALNGPQDAVLFKLSPNLDALAWSTYFGGSASETGNSVQIAQNGDVYITGGTESNNLPLTIGQDLSYNGGMDGYLARFNGNTGTLLSGTYIGGVEYDQSFFVQLDIDDDVYVYGQTEANLGVVGAAYGVANSGQFIWKYDHNISSILWKTMIGAGTGHVELSPTAFLVSDCYDIYIAGWGGQLNQSGPAAFSTTNGFPVTPDAHQASTNGSNFYIAVLGPNASSLKYGTYMGGVTSPYNHVDGGTSRFDKQGRIYHAVCGSCGAGINNGFTTTPGAYSVTSNSGNCNMAVFKFELSTIEAIVTDPDPVICLPDSVYFLNNSANGNEFFWDFGDNTTSNEVNPAHLYPGPGNYYVTLIVSDSNGCFTPDSVQFEVVIGDFTGGVITPTGAVCPGEPYQLEAYGGADYLWSPAQYLDDPTLAMPTATITQNTDFMVIISDSCGVDTAYLTLPVFVGSSTISNDTSVCIGNSVTLEATGGSSYLWSPSTGLSDPTIANPVCTPTSDITYDVTITSINGCEMTEQVSVDVYFTPPNPVIADTLPMCEASSLTIEVSGADFYDWSPNQFISTTAGPSVTVNPPSNMTYYCDFINACGVETDSVYIDVVQASILAGIDTIICPGETATLWAQGGISYQWWPSNSLNQWNTSLVEATPQVSTMYYVQGTDINGCVNVDSVFVDLYPGASITASPTVYAFYGDQVQLYATTTSPGPIIWTPAEFLTCVVCADPIANPNQNYTYYVSYTDVNGCRAEDSVSILYDPILYVPNTFTPGDGDSHNPVFKAEGGNFTAFEMYVFDRWGELIYTFEDINDSWDGTYEGNLCQDGTYVWKATLRDFNDEEHEFVGHVNLLR